MVEHDEVGEDCDVRERAPCLQSKRHISILNGIFYQPLHISYYKATHGLGNMEIF